ncbi:MAG: phosphoribosyl-AMP cyclohydrolase [Sphingomonadaceae bacterium]|uniref:phosphoribosyl-AMP cyclohydrolase n=1 Tax=Thermaurantiacus sp. TaxID=2820283 RepID=UPI00298F2DFE|nr:phosphoribosyl-AMP cyclohydrolase [Thermaurantiacus sp.]MCS6985861.1 phosphoribosyl-AMP cyclohydrolase [Sphingomonadaceae bacterium]MDW8413870.1 phosphoribosyl-AMP cyclohydrolase [Thermaurantiacus sp.]
MAEALVPRFDERGLLTAVAVHAATGQVLMVAHMNAEALERTLSTRQAHFWSRSRRRLWRKGETSGHGLAVQEVLIDCDQDAVLLKVTPSGPVCHTGAAGCFFRRIGPDGHLEPVSD